VSIIINSEKAWGYLPQIRHIMYDMDGTLFTSEAILHKAYEQAINQFNQKYSSAILVPTLEKILEFIGQPTKVIFSSLFPSLSESERGILNSYSLQNLCHSIHSGQGSLYPRIQEFLTKMHLAGYKQYIASNGRRAYLSSICEGFFLKDFFQEFVTIEDEGILSKAGIIKYYLNQSALDPKMAFMVGDRDADLLAAREAGVWFLGVNWGHGPNSEIAAADIIINTQDDLFSVFSPQE